MKPRSARHGILSATRIAEFCEVDLKTVHNWERRGKIRGTRTTGRHLRFRHLDVVEFLRAYGFAIPEALRQGRPRVAIVESDARALEGLQRALSRRFEVTAFSHVVDALLALASLDPDILLLGDAAPLGAEAVTARIAATERMRHVRVVSARGSLAEMRDLRERMERLAGLE
jgi:PleD family two-component response regulator